MSLEKPKTIYKHPEDGSLEISITYKVNECSDCPYADDNHEYVSTFCKYPGTEKFRCTPKHGFRPDCPLLKLIKESKEEKL